MRSFAAAALFTTLCGRGLADIVNYEYATYPARGETDDLLHYKTRPDLTPPKLEVKFHNRARVADGYIFVAPYDCLQCSHQPTTTYVTQQIGPFIYDQEGDLIWSGNKLFPDRKVFDFHPVLIDGQYHLSLVATKDMEWHTFDDGAALVLNASYDVTHILTSTELGHKIDLHEFNILEDGRTALMASNDVRDIDWEAEGITPFKGKAVENFFDEVDIETKQTKFHWVASDHIALLESTTRTPIPGDSHPNWDWFHINSVDKDKHGNYLISGRSTDAIYYIDKDGEILWRLGGTKSDFTQNFNFSRQHNARIRRSSKTAMVISFFDNAADDMGTEPTSDASSLKIVNLDLVAMNATLNLQHYRPDGNHSPAKGNVQYLENGNILAAWGENAMLSEFSKPGGELIYEAQWSSRRFANYRGYKMEFVGEPNEPPVAKSFVSTNIKGELRTIMYASWNGATEVKVWRFYAHNPKQGDPVYIGNSSRKGFETSFIAGGFHPIIFAEAMDKHWNSLGNSTFAVSDIPLGFYASVDPFVSGRGQSTMSTSDLFVRSLVAFVAGIGITVFWNRFRDSRRSSSNGSNNLSWRPESLRWVRKGE